MKTNKVDELKHEIEEYLTKNYCCELKEECKDGVRIRCSEYEEKLSLILKFVELKVKKLEQQIEQMKCCGNCSKYDRNNRVCSRTKFSVIETLCNCTNDWELRE